MAEPIITAHKRVKTILVDDHRIFLEGLSSVLRRSAPLRADIAGVFASGGALLEWLTHHQADLLVLDMLLPDTGGVPLIRQLRQDHPAMCIVILSASRDAAGAQAALGAGANAYIVKSESPESLIDKILAALNGKAPELPGGGEGEAPSSQDVFSRQYGLTRREVEVLRLLASGLGNKAIAERLYISDQTVGVHRKHIMRKTGVSNVAALVRLAIENQLI
jgi:DNA-binding NarL/FixJ family response regulator